MIHLRRRVADHIDVFQDETPAIVCPLAGQACLTKGQHRLRRTNNSQLTEMYHSRMQLMA